MWRWASIALLCLAVPAPARAAAPIAVGHGPGGLLALAAQDGTAYAVIGRAGAARPLALVRSTGRSAGRAVPFGIAGAENVDAAAGPDGVQVAWSRVVSSAFELSVTPARDPLRSTVVGRGTGPPQLDAGEPTALAYPDQVGDAVLGLQTLTADAPVHRHVPLDAEAGLVLDLDQQRGETQLRLLGPGAPARPAVTVPRLTDLDASLAVVAGRVYVAFAISGRAFLARAPLQSCASWRLERVATGVTGRPAVARHAGRTYVAYAKRGTIYLQGTRIGKGNRPYLAAGGRVLFAGWTHRDAAMLVRAR
jgi:hypothetical protein